MARRRDRIWCVIGQDALGEPYIESFLTQREAQAVAKRDVAGGCFAAVHAYVPEAPPKRSVDR